MSYPRIAITPGEPAGIGPDILLMLAQKAHPYEVVPITDAEMLMQRADILGLPIKLNQYNQQSPAVPQAAGTINVAHIDCKEEVIPGKLNPANAKFLLATLTRAAEGCMNNEFSAMVTGPINKSLMFRAGIPFSGHTECLASLAGNVHTVMLLTGNGLNVALATRHIPLQSVSSEITQTSLVSTINILSKGLKNLLNISNPKILVCGLNPHAGEEGRIGQEEKMVIQPAIDSCRMQGINVDGPAAADTAFTPNSLSNYDAILAMYHDQGLTAFKALSFGSGINVTLGLPFIRTSVDHGTALSLAGTGEANFQSLSHALNLAHQLSLEKIS